MCLGCLLSFLEPNFVIIYIHQGQKHAYLPLGHFRIEMYLITKLWLKGPNVFRQIICWQSRGTTTVMEVKLHYFRGHGNTTVVVVKNQVQLKKLRITKFIQKWKKKMLQPQPWYYHGHGSSVFLLPSPWQYRCSTSR